MTWLDMVSCARAQYGHWKSEHSTMVTFASLAPFTGLSLVLILAAIALNGSALTSSTSPKTTYLPSGDMRTDTSWLWVPWISFRVAIFAPGIFESVTVVIVASTPGGTLFLRR